MRLKISKTLSLPLDFMTSTQAILARKGRGKTYTGSVEAEELLEAGQQIVIIDPTDAWWGLKSSPDGRSTGYPIATFGGDHGDMLLEEVDAEMLADAIIAERFSAIICTDHLSKSAAQRFMWKFLERLYRKNREPLHLFVDEADMFSPQKPFGGDETRVLGAMDDVVRRGRKKGIGCTLISQRAQVLNKNVLSQIDQLIVLGMNHPLDIGAVEHWIAGHDPKGRAEELLGSLPTLPPGEAWVWNPQLDILKRITIRERTTFDSGATPKAGEIARTAKVLAPVDIARLGQAIKAKVEEQLANDPAMLKARIVGLEKLLAKPSPPAGKERRVEVPVIKPAELKRLEQLEGRLAKALERFEESTGVVDDVAGDIFGALEALRGLLKPTAPTAAVAPAARGAASAAATRAAAQLDGIVAAALLPKPSRRSSATPASGAVVGGGGLRRILIALAQRPAGLTNRQLGVRAGLSSKSGSFSTYISRGRTEGWIVDGGAPHLRLITDAGIAALGDFDPLPTGLALGEHWLRELGAGEARILRCLIDAYPSFVDPATIGARANLSTSSGTYSTYVSRLRGLELIEGRGALRASEELFDVR